MRGIGRCSQEICRGLTAIKRFSEAINRFAKAMCRRAKVINHSPSRWSARKSHRAIRSGLAAASLSSLLSAMRFAP